MSKIADYCGVVLLLRQLVEAGHCTSKEAARIAARIARQSRALRMKRREKCSFAVKEHSLAGRAYCGQCGSLMRVKNKGGQDYLICRNHNEDSRSCPVKQIPVSSVYDAFLCLHYNLRHVGMEMLCEMLHNLITIRNRQMLWHPDIVEMNKRISDISNQIHKISLLNQQGLVESDYFISKSNQLAKQLRTAKQQKEKLLEREDDELIKMTRLIIESLEDGPADLDSFDEELFCELIDRIIVESNTRIRFRLKNGLELPESIERMAR